MNEIRYAIRIAGSIAMIFTGVINILSGFDALTMKDKKEQ